MGTKLWAEVYTQHAMERAAHILDLIDERWPAEEKIGRDLAAGEHRLPNSLVACKRHKVREFESGVHPICTLPADLSGFRVYQALELDSLFLFLLT